MAVTTNYVEIISSGTSSSVGGSTKNIDNIYRFRRTTNGNPYNPVHVEAAFQTAIMIPVTNLLSAGYTQSGNSVRSIDDANEVPTMVPRALPGQIALPREPDYVCIRIRMRTALKGKSGRGAKSYSPIAVAHLLGDTITGPCAVLCTAVIAALTAGFTDADGNLWIPVIVSKVQNKLPVGRYDANPTAIIANDVTGFVLNKSVGTMYRRKIRTVT